MNETKEHQAFRVLEHWRPLTTIPPVEEIVSPSSPLFHLFSHAYAYTQKLYGHLPRRKNGEDAFIHPCNVVMFLRKAKTTDEITLCAGMLHDVVEEQVDQYRIKNKLSRSEAHLKALDAHEEEIFQTLEQELQGVATNNKIVPENVTKIITILRLLTRHKRHYYYKSIAGIFDCPDPEIKEAAITVKLADRVHNILCIECFTEQERLYQCFKNLFILNNTKKYLLDRYGQEEFVEMKFFPVEKLFNKCCKATYDAFVRICALSIQKGLEPIKTLLQIAFKKYALATKGLWEVTTLDPGEVHPTRLFQGVVRKYDARLLHQQEKFERTTADERNYCRRFFVDYNFSDEQILAILDYKDAFALKEVVANLLYNTEYMIGGFLISDLTVGKAND
ncbi:HD domain-containing protein [Candidatus Woesearchaeota archaeon]|nr:HD domain-containing protein [Candidatus Woesearchaeota archaeon]